MMTVELFTAGNSTLSTLHAGTLDSLQRSAEEPCIAFPFTRLRAPCSTARGNFAVASFASLEYDQRLNK